MDGNALLKSGQEQVTAAWVGLINQLRIDAFLEALRCQNANFEKAMDSMEATMEQIERTIATNRGGDRGVHGFIAEVAEVGFGNAKSLLAGGEKIYEWVNDNGPDDLFRFPDGKHLQMKFVSGGGQLSLNAVFEHLQKYPDYIEKNGAYQIPKDFYEVVKTLYEMPQEEAMRLVKGGELTYRRWKLVHDYIDGSGLRIENLEPSDFRYKEVQKGVIANSMESRKESLRAENDEIRKEILREGNPTPKEAAGVAIVSGAIEGTAAFVLAVRKRLTGGKRIGDIDASEWAQIAQESGFGIVKGAVRGGTVYILNNYTATPAAIASALVTASFGIADQANKLRTGDIDEVGFIENSELLCLDASVSALSAFMGQALLPIPILGALIGNTAGMMMYQLAKDILGEREASLARKRLDEQSALDAELEDRYGNRLTAWRADIAQFTSLLNESFSPSLAVVFSASARIASTLGVPEEQILREREDIDRYFLG